MTTDKPTVYDDSSEYVTDEMVSAAKLILCGADPDIDAGIGFVEEVEGIDIVREALEAALAKLEK